MRSAIENWYAKVCKISEYSIRYTLKVGLTPWRRPLSAYYVGVDNSSGTEILLYIIMASNSSLLLNENPPLHLIKSRASLNLW